MQWDQFISPTSIAGLLTMLGAVTAAIIAAKQIKNYKAQKSYDLFTAQRLQNHDCILKAYQEIMALSSPACIDDALTLSAKKYLSEYEVAFSKLLGLFSTVGKHEYYLFREFDSLSDMIRRYIESQTSDNKQRLLDQRNLIMYFMDIYLWALWNYIQRLYKLEDENEYHDFYNEFFLKYYKRSKELNSKNTSLFEKYPVDLFIDQSLGE